MFAAWVRRRSSTSISPARTVQPRGARYSNCRFSCASDTSRSRADTRARQSFIKRQKPLPSSQRMPFTRCGTESWLTVATKMIPTCGNAQRGSASSSRRSNGTAAPMPLPLEYSATSPPASEPASAQPLPPSPQALESMGPNCSANLHRSATLLHKATHELARISARPRFTAAICTITRDLEINESRGRGPSGPGKRE